MKIYFSPASPFVRKCLVAADELGVAEKIERLPSAAHPVHRDSQIVASNPLGQVPTFFLDDGTVLYDSRVICEYLDSRFGPRLIPEPGAERWARLTEQSLADGMLGGALLARYETAVRPEALRWSEWAEGQLAKVRSGLHWLEQEAPGFGERVDIGTLSFGCALGYLDFRFPAFDWRAGSPEVARWFERFNARPSMQATLPHA